MMLDLGPFSNENFDPKKWINSASQTRHPQDSLDKHLVDMEMKLQMVSEEIAASFEEQSAAALLRVPRATRDVIRLRDDAVSLRSAVSAILQKLKKAEGSSAESIAALAKVDVVKQRMEAAYETLQDAAGLTQLSATVEDVFASGDLPRAAETLANMRHCLSAVGEVAEFANIRKQLEVLEDRLDTMVQPRLTDALSNRKVDAAQDLRGILIRIGRFKSLESQYIRVHLKPIKQLWEDFESRERASKSANEKDEMERTSSGADFQSVSPAISFFSWLPSFYDELLLYLEQEWKWCTIAFPEDYKTLVPRLLSETMLAIGASFISRINLAIGDAVPETKALAKGLLDILSGDMQKGIKIQTKHLEALIELHNMTGTFARNIQHLFSGSDVRVLMDVLKAVYLPYESFKQRYGQMERAILSSEIAGVDLRGAVIRGVGAQGVELSETVRRMEESIPQIIILFEAAAERCISFTGGSEADELILALDDIMLQYISTLQETLKSLRTVCGVDYGGDGTVKKEMEKKDGNQSSRRVDLLSNEEEWSIVQGALQILTVADSLTSRSSVFEASLRATLARLSTTLSFSAFGSSLDQNQTINSGVDGELSFGGRAALDMATLRLVDVPEKARKLFNLLNQSKDPRFHALPLASQRVAAFADTVNELVYDVLISKVRQRLSDVSRLPIWSSVEEQGAFPLPTFSAYPQSYVTSVGEYLLTLPQQLEPLAEGISNSETNDEAQFFATEWMFKVAEGATALYIEQLRGIQYISDRGAQQLSVDIEYLSNVLSALSMPIPPVLATFQSCLSTPRNQLKDLLKIDSANQLDLPTANLVCKMRRVNLDS
ncbi:conserved oligomeric Golgi complex subunit 7 isoform X2 [Abrus precatorius]|uniref:Conserved oligomeric Golgi complex subunit 7 n=1 Tax=Abrus precatorius TaxID=3816 RepID=A0A8B8LED6_ABRPR|nr:conserved oligomeric Golgi complex subunit 7 isoform X2 [Abrus precatorius]